MKTLMILHLLRRRRRKVNRNVFNYRKNVSATAYPEEGPGGMPQIPETNLDGWERRTNNCVPFSFPVLSFSKEMCHNANRIKL